MIEPKMNETGREFSKRLKLLSVEEIEQSIDQLNGMIDVLGRECKDEKTRLILLREKYQAVHVVKTNRIYGRTICI